MDSSTTFDFRHASFRGWMGLARCDITPPVGIYSRNWGAARHDVADSIHRPLTLTALTIASTADEKPLVLIDVDLGWWKTPQTAHQFLARVREALSLDTAQLIFALSHTHSGPPLMEADDALQGSKLLKVWFEQLFDATVKAVRDARGGQFEGVLEWHKGRCGLAANRDLSDPEHLLSNGVVNSGKPEAHPTMKPARFVCGYNPIGKSDDTLVVGRITDGSGTVRGTLVNYACHPTTLAWDNSAISPDFVGAMRETIQAATNAPALFLIGACGELAPRFQYVADPDVADRHGRELGYAALATLNGMEPPGTQLTYSKTVESGAPLAVWVHLPSKAPTDLVAAQTTVELPVKDWPSADELEQQRLVCMDRALEERLRRKRDIRRSLGDGASFNLPIYVWRLGSAVLVGCCCEPYSLLQQELRGRFPDRTIICMNLINGSIGYLPPAALYDSDVYTVWQTPFDRGSLEKTLETMTKAIHDVLSR